MVVVAIRVCRPPLDIPLVGWAVFPGELFDSADGSEEAVIAGSQLILLGSSVEGVAVRSSDSRTEVMRVELGVNEGSEGTSESVAMVVVACPWVLVGTLFARVPVAASSLVTTGSGILGVWSSRGRCGDEDGSIICRSNIERGPVRGGPQSKSRFKVSEVCLQHPLKKVE